VTIYLKICTPIEMARGKRLKGAKMNKIGRQALVNIDQGTEAVAWHTGGPGFHP
jgi:hypothetical protein